MGNSKAITFVPQILEEGYGIVLVQVGRCANCQKTTIAAGSAREFPAFWLAGRKEQLRRADWREKSVVTNANGEPLCVDCAPTAGAFRCALCEQDRKGDPQESFGDPPEHLCTPCYETVPAKTWDETARRLREEHRYDFE